MQPLVRTSPYIEPAGQIELGRKAGRVGVLPNSPACVTMQGIVPSPSRLQSARVALRRWAPRLIGLAGLCVFARVGAPLPVHAQSPSVEPERVEGKRQSGNTTQASGSEASSRDQSTDVEASPASQTRPPASAQRLARLDAVAPSPEPSPEPSPSPQPEERSADPDRETARSAQARPRGRTGPGGRKISLEDEFLIEGKLEKPSAYYILRRSTLDYDWARLDARFSPLVLESVQDPLF
jgi:hypothetical protein